MKKGMDDSLLDEFENILSEMEQALIHNDVNRVEILTGLEQTCLFKIVKKSKTDASWKARVQERIPSWIRQIEMNRKLLNQAVSINGGLINRIYHTNSVG